MWRSVLICAVSCHLPLVQRLSSFVHVTAHTSTSILREGVQALSYPLMRLCIAGGMVIEISGKLNGT